MDQRRALPAFDAVSRPGMARQPGQGYGDSRQSPLQPAGGSRQAHGSSTATLEWGAQVPTGSLAHPESKMECYSCHSSWTTSCGGCHLPIEANWKTARHHYEGGETRNYATYNPQVARDDMYLLGLRE